MKMIAAVVLVGVIGFGIWVIFDYKKTLKAYNERKQSEKNAEEKAPESEEKEV